MKEFQVALEYSTLTQNRNEDELNLIFNKFSVFQRRGSPEYPHLDRESRQDVGVYPDRFHAPRVK